MLHAWQCGQVTPQGCPHAPGPREHEQLKRRQKDIWGDKSSSGWQGTGAKGSVEEAADSGKGRIQGASALQALELLLPKCLPLAAQCTWLQVLFYKQNTPTISQLVHH